MDNTEKQKPISELKDFLKELKSYKRLLDSEKELTKSQERYKESLRERLLRKSSALKETIKNLTGKQYVKTPYKSFDMWSEALLQSRSRESRDALAFCIDATNEAIGKLGNDILKGMRDEQGNLIEKENKSSTSIETPKAFIAHGGETPALTKLKNYLAALGIEPLIVEEQPSRGRSIGENVDWYARHADFAIILATKGGKDTKTGSFIPRGNVLIEIGKAQELFPDRTIYLLQAGTKLPSNISEKICVRFVSQSMDGSFIRIAKELTEFGILKAVKP